MSKQDDNKAIVGRWFTEFWGKDLNLAVVDEIAAPDMLLKYSLHAPRRGRDDIKAFMTDFRAAFPDLNFWGTADLIAEGDHVVGQWEGGLLRKKVLEGDPVAVRMHQEQRWDVIPGAEPSAVFSARLRHAVERIAAAHRDQRVVVFSHGGTIGELLAQATGSQPFAFTGADNGSISELVITADRWILRRFNDTAHLDGVV